jgi:hypothetical protein
MPGPTRLRFLLAATLALSAVAAAPAAAVVQDPIPIRPNMYFTAQVNGVSSGAVVKVVCAGPASTGHPAAGQTVEVLTAAPVSSSVGYTGSAADSIDAIFSAPSDATNAPIVLSSFFAPQPIPTTLNLPCSGDGTVSFVPIPTSGTAHGFAVSVSFLDLGA